MGVVMFGFLCLGAMNSVLMQQHGPAAVLQLRDRLKEVQDLKFYLLGFRELQLVLRQQHV